MKTSVPYFAVACACLAMPPVAGAGETAPIAIPQLHEEAQAAGIEHSYTGPWEFFVGGGAASFDCNDDRLPDLFIAGGADEAKLYVNRSQPGGELRFEQRDTGLSEVDRTGILGAYPVNLDNDAHIDLVVLRLGENLLAKGGPDCTFEPANERFAFDGGQAWTTSAAAIWEADARFPTLAFGNYVDRDAQGAPWGTCHDNRLVRPVIGDDGQPDYSSGAALSPGYCALSVMFTDWNGRGDIALRVSNDRHYYRGGEEQLWQVPAGGDPRPFTQDDGWRQLNIWGMGIAAADLTGDGRPEYVLTSMGDAKLQMLEPDAGDGRPSYVDIALDKGTTAHRPYTGDDVKPSTSWHAQFADFNNDGRLDLFIAKGNVEAMEEAAAFDPDNLLLAAADGTFHEYGGEAGIAQDTKGRGAVAEDFNADGLVDLLVVNRGANVSAFRNLGAGPAAGGWLMIEPDAGPVNRHAVGAQIHVTTAHKTQTRTVRIGGGHASGQTGFTHFGLGSAQQATVRIRWPDGSWSAEQLVEANRFVSIARDGTVSDARPTKAE